MGKALKAVGTAILIVGAAVATGGAALAVGAGVGLGGAAGLAGTAVLSVGGFSMSAGALMSVGSLVASIGGSMSQPKVSTAGSALGWVGDPNGPMHFAAGRIAVGGDLRHKAAYGPDDRMYFSAVTVVSDAGPIDAFESFTANDVAVTFDGSGKAVTSYYANVMWRRTQLGRQPEPSFLSSPAGLKNGASLPNWGASHKLSAKAAFILTLAENSKQSAYKGQYPKPRTIIRGLRVYDWRFDSSVPGGAGPCRLNDPDTWPYSANPILWSVKWLLGLWEGPNGKGAPQVDYQVGGIGTRWENIDVAAFTEAANIADTHGWTCAAWPSTDDDKAQVLDAFLQAGGAYYIERAGKASCIHRAAPRVSVATITAADTAGPIELDTSASYLARKNTGVATYLSEADGWKMTALPEVTSPQWVTEDGGRQRTVPVTYSYVDRAKQAAELMCLGLAHTREGISGRIPLKSYMQGIVPGSAFTIHEPEFVLNGLKCLCLETNYDALSGVHTVTFVSETDAKYPYAYGQEPNPPAPPALTPVDPTQVIAPLPAEWTIVPRPPGEGGVQLPIIDIIGDVGNSTATAVHFEWSVSNGEPWQSAGIWPPTVKSIPIPAEPGTQVWIAVSYMRGENFSERTIYGPVLVPDLIAGGLAPDSPDWTKIRELANGEAAAQLIAESEARQAAALAAAEARLEGVDATLFAGQAGLNSRLVLAETAIADLPGQYTAISRTQLIEADIQAAQGGYSSLNARLLADQTATANALTGKASVSDLNALSSQVSNQNLTISGMNTRLNTVETDLAGKASSAALATVSAAVATKNTIRDATTAPTTVAGYTPINGDLWINRSDNGRQWQRVGGAWVEVTDPRIGQATGNITALQSNVTALQQATADLQTGKADASALASVSATASSKNAIRYANTGPVIVPGYNAANGDLWVNLASNNRTWQRVDGQWVEITDPRIAQAATNITTLQSSVTSLQQATVDLQNGKANASDVTNLTSRANTIEANLSVVSATAADSASKLAEARFAIIAAASGGNPARFGIQSTQHGSNIALDADQIWFGPNTYFDKATWTLRTTVGAMRYVQAWGPPFGADSLTYWRGPTSVANGAERKNNVGSGAWEDSSGDSFFGGSTLTGFFSSSPSGGAISLDKTTWKEAAVFSLPTRQGWFALFAGIDFWAVGGWVNPEPEMPAWPPPRVDVRVVSTNASGGDLVVLATGTITRPSTNSSTFVNRVWLAHEIVLNNRSGERRIAMQARLGQDNAANTMSIGEVRNGIVQGYYLLGNAPGTGAVPPTPPVGQSLVWAPTDNNIYLTVPE